MAIPFSKNPGYQTFILQRYSLEKYPSYQHNQIARLSFCKFLRYQAKSFQDFQDYPQKKVSQLPINHFFNSIASSFQATKLPWSRFVALPFSKKNPGYQTLIVQRYIMEKYPSYQLNQIARLLFCKFLHYQAKTFQDFQDFPEKKTSFQATNLPTV